MTGNAEPFLTYTFALSMSSLGNSLFRLSAIAIRYWAAQALLYLGITPIRHMVLSAIAIRYWAARALLRLGIAPIRHMVLSAIGIRYRAAPALLRLGFIRLSGTRFADTFYRSVGCLFIFTRVSFAVEKLSSLIWPVWFCLCYFASASDPQSHRRGLPHGAARLRRFLGACGSVSSCESCPFRVSFCVRVWLSSFPASVYWGDCSFLIVYPWLCRHESVRHVCVGLFLGRLPCPTDLCVCFYASTMPFRLPQLCSEFEIWEHDDSSFVLSQDCFEFLGFLSLHTHFRLVCASVKKSIRILIKIVLNF